MWTIYKITNKINNKKYIGQTCRPVEERWSEHERGKTSSSSPLNRAIKKYGWENFSKEIIEYVDTAKKANEREQYWIEYYKTAIPKYGREAGYNLTLGGEGVKRITEEQKELVLHFWDKQYNITQISKIMNIDRHNVSSILYQFNISKEEIEERRYTQFHQIYVYDLMGNLIDIYNSLQEVRQYYPQINKSQLQKVLTHSLASTHKLIFLYEEDKDKLFNHLQRSHKFHKGKIKSINIITKEEIIYNSISEAQKITGIDRHTIRNRIKKNIIKNNIKWEDVLA